MEKTSLLTLPEDMIIEILLRMPLKSLVQCTCASKALASIIRRKDFRDAHLDRSMKMPRLLFIDENAFERYVVIHSVYQEKKPLLSSGQQHTRNIPLYPPRKFSDPICGLICIQKQTKVWICNPGAEKVLSLPEIQGHRASSLRCFFSYDKDVDAFKVLCMTNEPKESKKYQVFTLGLGEKAWRSISCQHHHSPVTQGICIEGVLYYGALSNSKESVVMSFNVKSEEFTVIELPEGVNMHEPDSKLVNYKGNIALGIVNQLDGVFEMWVRKNEGVGIRLREKKLTFLTGKNLLDVEFSISMVLLEPENLYSYQTMSVVENHYLCCITIWSRINSENVRLEWILEAICFNMFKLSWIM